MPLDTVLCLDTSGSMANRGIRELKRAATEFLNGIEETAKQSQLKVCKAWFPYYGRNGRKD
jgi:Mg-chelatase subunit ChlD